MSGKTYIEIRGRDEVFCQGGAEMDLYTDELVIIKTLSGKVHISGSRLRLCYMSDDRIVIVGEIEGIRYE